MKRAKMCVIFQAANDVKSVIRVFSSFRLNNSVNSRSVSHAVEIDER